MAEPQSLQTIVVAAAAGGNTTVYTGIAGQRWAVLSAHLSAAANTTYIVLSGATALTGTVPLLTTNPLTFDADPVWVDVAAGDNLVLTVGGGGAIAGWVNILVMKL